jgi:hypothetical protein
VRNQSALVIPFDGLSETVQPGAATVRIKDAKVIPDGQIFHFQTANGLACWTRAKQGDDPLVQFLYCLQEIRPHLESLPKEFIQQFVEMIGAPDLLLAMAIGASVPPARRDVLWHLYTALAHSEALTSFFRTNFARDINRLNDPNPVYRDNSVAMTLTGIILRAHGHEIIDNLFEIVEANPSMPAAEMFEKWMPILESTSQTNRILLRIAFTAARRKYPDGIVPMTAISGVLMLRHIMARMGSKVGQVAPLQQVMNISVFRGAGKETAPKIECFG